MDTTTIVMIVLAALVILVVGGLLGVVFARRQRSKKLRRLFGPEYDRMLRKVGDKNEAESALAGRLEHVENLSLRTLTLEEKKRFAQDWRQTQAVFVEQPAKAIREANRLVKALMSAMGYPVDDPEQRIADLSVSYPELISNYRRVTEIAARNEQDGLSTEEMRQAMIHCRALFSEMLGGDVIEQTRYKETVA